MIPDDQKFPDMEPISGTVDDILNYKYTFDIDSEEHCQQEIMHKYSLSKRKAVYIYKKVKLKMVQIELDKMVRDGIIYVSGKDKKGNSLYKLVEQKN